MLLLFPVGMQLTTYIWKKTLDPHSFKSRQIVLSKNYEFLLYFSAGSYYSFQTHFLRQCIKNTSCISVHFKNSRTIKTGISTENSNLKKITNCIPK